MNTRDIYAEAMELAAAAPDENSRSILWSSNGNDVRNARFNFSDTAPFIQWLTSVNYFSAPHLGPEKDAIVAAWRAFVKEIHLSESTYANPAGAVILEDRIVSTVLMQALYYAKQIETVKPRTFLEIGAGFGVLARVLTSREPRPYTIVDLPSSLFCSYVYLRTHFPDLRFVWCNKASDFGTPFDFRFIPADLWWTIAGETFDIAINTCSLGEMLAENRDDYMDLIQRTARHFYSHNRHGTERFPTLPADTALPAIVLGEQWEILFDEVEGAAQTDPETPPSREMLVRRR